MTEDIDSTQLKISQQDQTEEKNQNMEPITPRCMKINHKFSDIIGDINEGVLKP